MDPKKVEALITCQYLHPRRSKFSMGWYNFIGDLLKTLPSLCHQSPICAKKFEFFEWTLSMPIKCL
jgi:hypothetical protein